ncbi:hypothetical protein HYW75_00510 [Candidatus Pacearchaeota archaeon]|nr:hypothetical protein [Candidatus Pacearchaeota archaeon]
MKNSRGIIIGGFVFLSVIMMLSIVIANETPVPISGKASDSFKCKVSLTISYMDSLIEAGANLSSYSEKLQSDISQIDAIVSSGNRSAFKDFVKDTFESDFKSSRDAINQWRKDNNKNLTKEQKASFRESYQNAKKTFDDCHKNSLLDLGNQRIELFEKIIAQYKERTDKFAAKGLDTAGMNKVLEGANTQVINPMKNALISANDSQSIKNILRKYCLFNGCKNGVNYHLAARYEMERLSATINFIKTKLNSTEYDGKIKEAESNLNAAKGILSEIATSHNNDNGKQIWNKATSSYKTLKNLNKNVNKENRKAVKDE